MSIMMIICLLFAFGSMGGWVLELFYRRIFSSKKWINPGFLVGPCLPLYGFGISILFLLSYILKFNEWFNIPSYLNIIFIIIIMGIMMTVIEYIAGEIFIIGMGIKLWDYSDRWGNIKGIICPLFSLIWTIVAAGFYFLIRPVCDNLINWFQNNAYNNMWLPFSLGLFYGVFFVDLCYSFKITKRIKEFAKENKIIIKLEQFKQEIREYQEKAKEKIHFIFPLKTVKGIKDALIRYKDKIINLINKKDDEDDK